MELYENRIKTEQAVLVGVHTGSIQNTEDTTEETMAELEELAKAAGAKVLGMVMQNRSSIDSATYVGDGKLKEIKEFCEANEADLIICDDELSGSQKRNIENATGIKVLDRSALILDIFAARAQSREGKLQVELAQLKYLLPRLTGQGIALSRLGGGIGTRGPGETKLETDKRHIKRRILYLEEQLKEIERHRSEIRKGRRKNGIQIAALVGYTNAGKSTLLNALTDAGVLAEDKLFATLDPTARALSLPDGRQLLLIDTVGFIRKLPHHLIKAFKSTLEEAVLADIIINVTDLSSPEEEVHLAVTGAILKDLGCADKPMLIAYNKCDRADGEKIIKRENAVYISALKGTGLVELLQKISLLLPSVTRRLNLFIPFSDGATIPFLKKECKVLSESYDENGTRVEAIVENRYIKRVEQYIL